MRRAALAGALAVLLTTVGGLVASADSDGTAGSHRTPIGDGRGGFGLKRIAEFDDPIYVHGPPGAGDLVYVVDRRGLIKVLDHGRKRKGSFLDIRDRVSCCESERGLFSIAFPNFRHDRRFYVFYTDKQGDLRIVEFRRRKGTFVHAREASARPVLQVRHREAANHNGGQLQFGPHRLLYISTGDGGTGGDPAQRKGSRLGKLLRIDPRRHGRRPYRVPRSNPFVGERGDDTIFARGLRNPWRFSIDRSHIVIGDVGESSHEEVDYESLRHARRANFGWNVFEGRERIRSGSISGYEPPIHQYGHGGGHCAITGGYVSRDGRIRALYGRYVYADLCAGVLRSLIPRDRGARRDRSLGVRHVAPIVSFGEDAKHRLYAVEKNGAVYRIVPHRRGGG